MVVGRAYLLLSVYYRKLQQAAALFVSMLMVSLCFIYWFLQNNNMLKFPKRLFSV